MQLNIKSKVRNVQCVMLVRKIYLYEGQLHELLLSGIQPNVASIRNGKEIIIVFEMKR